MTEKSLTDSYISEITENFRTVRGNIDAAGGNGKVTLLAATKTLSADIINYAIDNLGLEYIGENRVQELISKYDSLHRENLHIHFIGRLQKNKVKYIIDKVEMIESLDSYELAEVINRCAAKICRVMDVLVEVNIGSEQSKGGVPAQEAKEFINSLSGLENIRVRGLMVIPPISTSEEYEVWFTKSHKLFSDIFGEPGSDNGALLSMGMSESYIEAVKCGSTLVRVGSALFGKRDYPAFPEKPE